MIRKVNCSGEKTCLEKTIRCPECDCYLLQSNLEKHLQRVHNCEEVNSPEHNLQTSKVPQKRNNLKTVVAKSSREINESSSLRKPGPKKCSCNGANPNCMHCGGWGYIGDDTDLGQGYGLLSTPCTGKEKSYKGWKKSNKSKAAKTTPCPYCLKKFRGKNGVNAHVNAKHPEKWSEFAKNK